MAVIFPEPIRERYEIYEWRNAAAVLQAAHPDEWNDILGVLGEFRLLRSEIEEPGGRKSPIASRIDGAFFRRGWTAKSFDIEIHVDGVVHKSPTHEVDCLKGSVALEVEWNNKDPFYDRDLNNFRLLFDLRAIDVGIIITRCDELQDVFASLGKGSSYGASTTHLRKLLPRVEGGGGGGCPLLVFGIRANNYVNDAGTTEA